MLVFKHKSSNLQSTTGKNVSSIYKLHGQGLHLRPFVKKKKMKYIQNGLLVVF